MYKRLLLLIIASLILTVNSCTKLKTDVTVCDLLENSDSYLDKTVRVKATYYVGFEWSFIACSQCPTEENILIDFEKLNKEDIEMKQEQLKRDYQYNDLIANVIFVGKFRNAYTYKADGTNEHLLEVQSVESVNVLFNEVSNSDSSKKREIAEAKAGEFCKN